VSRPDQLIEERVQAAFDRYNRAVLSGVEPTPELFIESLEAEGLRLLPAAQPVYRMGTVDRRVAERRRSGGSRQPVGSLLTRRLKGLS
jgi:hypothetical protein